MNEAEIPGAIVDRLRANLRADGIAISDIDLQGMTEKGLLRNVVAFEEIDHRLEHDLLPDYLAAWGPDAKLAPAGEVSNSASTTMFSSRQDPGETGRGDGYPSITSVASRIQARDVSPVELTAAALKRIAERDPVLNAFQLVLRAQATTAAEDAEREIAAGNWRGPLHGVPIAVKDLVTMAGTATTAGSKILTTWVTDFDSAAVESLRRAGAIIVGKTRLPEFAYSPGSNNPHYGSTHNPWNLEHDTGGSSSGSGAAVADGLVYGALGSDTGGSIRIPAALCGIVGLKPTFGRVSLRGAVSLAWSLDHLGPLTRTVEDAAIMLRALAGPDSADPRMRATGWGAAAPLTGVAGLRIGVLRDDGSGIPLGTPETLAAWKAGLTVLERNGARLEEIDLPEMRDLRVVNGAIIGLEAIAYHGGWLRGRLDDYGEFARQRLLAAYGYGPSALARAEQARSVIRRRFDTIFDRVDLLSTPTMPYGAPKLGTPGATVFTGPFNAMGWPAISVPVGLGAGRLPLGLQLAGRPWDEATVLRAAAVVEADGPWQGGCP